jgi:hypothetical protein
MSDEPSYPKDASVGGGAAETGAEPAPQQPAAPKRKKQFVKTGVAVGIGSAAIVAALLYANRPKRGDKENN